MLIISSVLGTVFFPAAAAILSSSVILTNNAILIFPLFLTVATIVSTFAMQITFSMLGAALFQAVPVLSFLAILDTPLCLTAVA
jgi:hypothetical protein